jgi:hypothetical protein
LAFTGVFTQEGCYPRRVIKLLRRKTGPIDGEIITSGLRCPERKQSGGTLQGGPYGPPAAWAPPPPNEDRRICPDMGLKERIF